MFCFQVLPEIVVNFIKRNIFHFISFNFSSDDLTFSYGKQPTQKGTVTIDDCQSGKYIHCNISQNVSSEVQINFFYFVEKS